MCFVTKELFFAIFELARSVGLSSLKEPLKYMSKFGLLSIHRKSQSKGNCST